MIPAKDRLLLQPRDSLYPIVIYHGTPFAQLGRHWARLLSSSSSSLSRFEIMKALLGEGGGGDPPAVGSRRRSAGGNNNNNIYAVQLELGPPPLPAVPAEPESQQSLPTPTTTTAAKEEDDRPAGSSSLFLARLIPSGVPILPETGRAVLKAALGFGTCGSGSGSGNGGGAGAAVGSRAATGGGGGGEGNLQDDGTRARPLDVDDDDAAKEEEGADGGQRSRRRRKRTALAWMRAVTLLRGGGGQAVNDDAQGVTYEQASSFLSPLCIFWRGLVLLLWSKKRAVQTNTQNARFYPPPPHPLAGTPSFYHNY